MLYQTLLVRRRIPLDRGRRSSRRFHALGRNAGSTTRSRGPASGNRAAEEGNLTTRAQPPPKPKGQTKACSDHKHARASRNRWAVSAGALSETAPFRRPRDTCPCAFHTMFTLIPTIAILWAPLSHRTDVPLSGHAQAAAASDRGRVEHERERASRRSRDNRCAALAERAPPHARSGHLAAFTSQAQ